MPGEESSTPWEGYYGKEGDGRIFWRCLLSRGYDIGRYLGKGRTCLVFQARSLDASHAAVKVIDKTKVRSQYYEDKLPTELSVWKSLHHRNLIGLLDHASDARWTYAIMEYFPGSVDMDEWLLESDRASPELARAWLRQLASALVYLKAVGYAHGDVKPKNVIVTTGDGGGDDGSLKLCDFGCMKPLNEGPSTCFCGSYGYVAPEVYRREPHDPEKADVWSYGVLAYRLATHGTISHPSNGYVYRLRRNWLSGVPTMSRPFFASVLQRRPEKRITFDQILDHPWIKDDGPVDDGDGDETRPEETDDGKPVSRNHAGPRKPAVESAELRPSARSPTKRRRKENRLSWRSLRFGFVSPIRDRSPAGDRGLEPDPTPRGVPGQSGMSEGNDSSSSGGGSRKRRRKRRRRRGGRVPPPQPTE